MAEPKYLNVRDAAAFCGVSASFLNKARIEGKGPRFYRPPGCRRIFYEMTDLVGWMGSGASANQGAAHE